jgi:drug/metabolite transporter (DMT)-like permease
MSTQSHTLRIGVAFLAVYFIWGTTYLAIRFGLEGFPPFMLNGIRFVIAGLVLAVIARVRSHPWPTKAQWWNSFRIGLLMMAGGIGLVSIAEDLGVGSGVAATAVAVIPMWVALITGFLGAWPNRREWIGLALGLVGVLVLVGEGDFRSTLAGTILIVVAPIFWSIGSVWSARADLPESSAMAPSAQLLSAGAALLVFGPIRGERITEMPDATSWLALAYLAIFGSMIAYTAYIYLLKNVRPGMVASYAYVNPAVAVIAAVTLGGEVFTGPLFVALPLILIGVAMATLGRSHQTTESQPVATMPLIEEAA